jgi:predicted transcriptional regulator
MTPQDIAARCKRLNLQWWRLAELSGLDETTVARTLNGKTRPLLATVDKMRFGLVAYEIGLLRHLHALHGCRLSEPVPPARLLAKAEDAA